MTDKSEFEKWWKNLKAPMNETITSKWYFKKGFEAGKQSIKLPSEEPEWPFDPPICNMGFTEYGKGQYEGFLEAKDRCKLAFKVWLEQIKTLNEVSE